MIKLKRQPCNCYGQVQADVRGLRGYGETTPQTSSSSSNAGLLAAGVLAALAIFGGRR